LQPSAAGSFKQSIGMPETRLACDCLPHGRTVALLHRRIERKIDRSIPAGWRCRSAAKRNIEEPRCDVTNAGAGG
jgi:hypothetical protein